MTKAPLPFSESGAFQLVKKSLFDKLVDAGEQAPPPDAAAQIFDLSRGSFAKGKT